MENMSPRSKGGVASAPIQKALASAYQDKRLEEYLLNPKICKQCQSPILPREREKVASITRSFCDQSCASSFRNKGVCRNKEAYRLKALQKAQSPEEIAKRRSYAENPLLCKVCSVPLPYERHKNQTVCSRSCVQIIGQEALKKRGFKPPGGPRIHSGRSKSGWYQGYHCGSTYELAYVVYCLDHKIQIERNTKGWEYFNPETGKTQKYYPDFIINGTELIEIKGYRTPETDLKLAAVDVPISLLCWEELEPVFEYVKEKTGYGPDKLPLLYEGTSHTFNLRCLGCSSEFTSMNAKQNFCTSQCALRKARIYRKFSKTERETGIEPATSSLENLHSTS